MEVEDRKNICPFRTNQYGEYYRLLLPGNYTFKVNTTKVTQPTIVLDTGNFLKTVNEAEYGSKKKGG